MRRAISVTFLFCALAFQYAKAQNPNWQQASLIQNSYLPYTMYEDTAAGLLYLGSGPNGVRVFDGSTYTNIGSNLGATSIRTIIKYNDTIYAGGVCIGKYLVKWNGTDWDTAGIGANGAVGALYVYNGEIYAGGVFTTIGGISANGLAKFDGTAWSNVGNFPSNYNYGIGEIIEYNGELYIGGSFGDTAGNVMNIARWDGSQWNSVGGGFHGGFDEVACFEIFNNELYIGGLFTIADGNVGDRMAKWDGTTLSGVGGGMSIGQVHDLAVYNNALYAGGTFQEAGGVFASRIAKWDGTDWCGLGDTLNNVVLTLGLYNDELYMGGGFWLIGSDTVRYLAKWVGGNYVDTCGNTTGIIENSVPFPVSVFPNPANETAIFHFPALTGKGTVGIYDAMGREIFNEQINATQFNVDVSDQPPGLYFYKLEQGGEFLATGKLIIE